MRTFGYFTLALQAQGAPESGAGGINFVELIARSNWLTKSVLLILLLFSAVSWGIILYKTWQDPGVRKTTISCRSSARARNSRKCRRSARAQRQPARRHLSVGLRRTERAASAASTGARRRTGRRPVRASNTEEPRRPWIGPCCARRRPRSASSKSGCRSLRHGEHHAVHRPLRHGVGHHGGVPEHRRSTGRRASASSRPGIAEALIATAAGSSRPCRRSTSTTTSRAGEEFAAQMDDFSLEFLNISERNFT